MNALEKHHENIEDLEFWLQEKNESFNEHTNSKECFADMENSCPWCEMFYREINELENKLKNAKQNK
ncbi:hypothetical protein R5O24_07660 [Tenacibaculum maritimum]|uniref:hypothetical protein n=1 Tax=Tenacibaculum maritimum TaxID=107401 RepID=UPI00388F492B